MWPSANRTPSEEETSNPKRVAPIYAQKWRRRNTCDGICLVVVVIAIGAGGNGSMYISKQPSQKGPFDLEPTVCVVFASQKCHR